ncbi:MAG TPA: hypothetical protein PLH75_03225 [Amaricoccus sp.]|uniref:hypothetical protein n=1 Tax=Amaricoccus sp. TaxID=1872485 RepID=UPI001DC8D48A|nr:hypothetical protein [Amaricoccus sp.]MCB1370400.1 hypothetical protein [Paracoccaceae bacterium]MCB1373560.1 hypothetical protein [Paracoccaceae bacterium]HPG21783.1 hypothetical protein [Amaricoccus sp.]HRW15124.1 hypothetical protein [Amaricoccus sp.]
MKSLALLAAGMLLLAACNTTGTPDPYMETSGGAAGQQGEGYCATVPTDPTEIENWNNQCMPDSNRR